MGPTTAKLIPISLNGEARNLRFGFRAFDALKVNPFEAGSIARALDPLDVRKAASFVWAGLLHEKRQGETVEDIIDALDLEQFMGILAEIRKAGGEDPDKEEEGAASGDKRPSLA